MMRQLKQAYYLIGLLIAALSGSAFAFDCTQWTYPQQPQSASENNASSARYNKGLLWEIRAPNGAISYLFGTIHLSDQRILQAAQFAESRLVEMNHFVMEVLVTPDTARFSVARMFHLDAQRLSQQVPPGLYEKTVDLLRAHGMGGDAVDKLKPWAAYMTLAVPPATGGIPLDLHLLGIASEHGKQLHGLESIEEQLGIFEQLELESQVSLLAEAVCNYAENQAQVETMISLYAEQNLGALIAIGEKYQTPVNTELLERLLFQRNETMGARMLPWLRAGGFFIAVGALHLPGDRGLLASLASEGFTVRAVDYSDPAQ